MVGRGLPTYAYLDNGNYVDNMTGSEQNDMIFGERGNDTLRDGAGNDVVYGGQGDDHFYSDSGNDFFYGGENDDYYYVNGANRTVRIEDKDGTDNRVMINGRPIVRFYKAADGSLGYEYSSADGRFTGTREGIDFVVTDNTTSVRVILNENFEEGDFGIQFYDELTPSENPVTDNVIQGDQDPEDLDDALIDTAGNDLILCGDGDDIVTAPTGGEDWIKGEDGSDLIDAQFSTNCIIEGGADSDVLFGSYVSGSQIFADIFGEKEDLIEAGETAQGTDEKGDLIAGGYPGDDNFLYGSNGNDILLAYSGNDLMVGGGGDDLIRNRLCMLSQEVPS
jgi:Ca2+-binding RTX toxin-like protein